MSNKQFDRKLHNKLGQRLLTEASASQDKADGLSRCFNVIAKNTQENARDFGINLTSLSTDAVS